MRIKLFKYVIIYMKFLLYLNNVKIDAVYNPHIESRMLEHEAMAVSFEERLRRKGRPNGVVETL